MFSFLDKPFRTGASKAAREAKAAGRTQLGLETEFREEIKGLFSPTIERGQQAFTGLADFYGGDQQPIISQAQSSPLYSSLVGAGESAIARNRQATGGFRSGTTQENLAENEQGVLMSLIQQILQGQGGIADAGAAARNAYVQSGGSALSQIGGTSGQIANIGIQKAAGKANILSGLAQAGATAFASDKKLKENILKIGEKNGLNWYSWDWNDLAKGIGLSGSDEGHIAQEVEEVRPDLVVMQNGYKAVIYGGF
jgi:hypothetical protein